MATTLETLLILKAVSVFSETPDDVLATIVPLLEELHLKQGDIVFHKGDLGDSMYIIVDGEVRVHDGDMTLNYLSKRAVFGEMSAMDPEPRSATVTASQDTTLLRLDRETFFHVMEHSPDALRGVVRVLCQRLRARMRDMLEDFTYMQQFARVTAAASAVEAGVFEPDSLDEVAMRTDALGQLARVFQRMTIEVYMREQRLKQQVSNLQIEVDKIKQERQVQEITESDYFQQLQEQVKGLRRKSRRSNNE